MSTVDPRAGGPDGLFPGSPDWSGVEADGHGWLEFRQTLRPRYWKAWGEIALSYLMLVGGYALAWWADGAPSPLGARLAIGAVAAVLIGFWLHALPLFGHEAAHYNLAPSRRWNDRLADWLVWPLYPMNTKSYRRFHWQHHLHLGDHRDTEVSYQQCLSPGFLASLVTGVYLIKKLLQYAGHLSGPRDESVVAGPDRKTIVPSALIRALVLHCLVIGIPLALGRWSPAVVWLLGALVVYPVLNTVRQNLEHRRDDATCADDFSREIEHGAQGVGVHGFARAAVQ